MSPALYQPVFLAIMALLACVLVFRSLSSDGYAVQEQGSGFALPLVLSVILVFWIGLRPVSSVFGDTVNYARMYYNIDVSLVSIDWSSEWIWQWLEVSCKAAGLDLSAFFTIVEAGYVFSVLWAIKRFMPTNPLLGMMFVFLSLMYFSFGVNGLRNGLACHLVLLAFSFLLDDKLLPGVALCLVAFGIHRSVILPIAAYVAARYFIKDIRYAIYFWLFSIPLSLVAGGPISNFFASLGFDNRMSSYMLAADDEDTMAQFGQTGFRWDFLLYSAMPIWMAWTVNVKRAVRDNWYSVLANTYCLSNAFWVLVIRSSFSNRFAYLSWFLYPIIIAYPLIMMPVWDDQDKKTGQILLAYGAFTIIMNTLYW